MAAPQLQSGHQLGDFTVVSPVGAGGQGTVYRARQHVLERDAVIKVAHASGAAARTAFLDEAKLASALSHPYAAHVYAFGAEDAGPVWIAMELVEGTSLYELLALQGPLALERCVPLVDKIAEVVAAAHELLVRSFASRAARSLGRQRPVFSDESFELLRTYSWPGNVRELRNVIERAVLLAGDDAVEAEHLPLEKMRATVSAPTRSIPPPVAAIGAAAPANFHVGAAPPAVAAPAADVSNDDERERLLRALQQTAGNQTRAAELLGISRRTMVNWLNKYGIARPRKPVRR